MSRFIIGLMIAVFLQSEGLAQSPASTQSSIVSASSDNAKDKESEVRRQTFDLVWKTVKDKHFDPNFGGVNWDKVRDDYTPRLASLKNNPELYQLLQQMLNELGQSHFNIIPAESVVTSDEKEPAAGHLGIDLRIIQGEAVITRVDAGSEAAKSGLKPGYVIRRIDENPVERIIEPVMKSRERDSYKGLMMARRLMARIGGEPGSAVRIQYLDGHDGSHEVEVRRQLLKGELSQPLGNFPPQFTEFESTRLNGNLGLIRFNIFTIPIMAKVRTAIGECRDCAGLIFDLRGNPGGVGGIASGIAGLLSSSEGSLGTMKMRSTQLKFAFFPQPESFKGPVVIIIDGSSASTSEVFAGGMQEIGRAKIIGETSMGAALPSIFQKLPTGALFQFAIADFKTPKGILVEGRGVIPDLEVRWNRKALLSGHDSQLDAAIKLLQTDK